MPVKIRIYLNTFSTANTANYWLIKMEIGTFNLALRILFVFTVTFYFDLWIPNNKYCTLYSVQVPSIWPFGSCLYLRLPSILISGSRITSTVQCTGTFNLALWNRTSSTGTFNLALWIQNCKNGYLQCCPPNLMLYISTGTFNLALRISNSTDGCLQSCLPNLKLEVWEPSILPPVSTIASRTTFNLALLVSNDKLDIMQPGLEAALLA